MQEENCCPCSSLLPLTAAATEPDDVFEESKAVISEQVAPDTASPPKVSTEDPPTQEEEPPPELPIEDPYTQRLADIQVLLMYLLWNRYFGDVRWLWYAAVSVL